MDYCFVSFFSWYHDSIASSVYMLDSFIHSFQQIQLRSQFKDKYKNLHLGMILIHFIGTISIQYFRKCLDGVTIRPFLPSAPITSSRQSGQEGRRTFDRFPIVFFLPNRTHSSVSTITYQTYLAPIVVFDGTISIGRCNREMTSSSSLNSRVADC